MVLDAAKGIEPQTLKLFEVCRDRGLPLLTFLNKWDRPGRDPLELLDEIEEQIGVHAHAGHVAGRLRRRLPRRRSTAATALHPLRRAWPAARRSPPRSWSTPTRAAEEEGDAWTAAPGRARAARAGPDARPRLVPGRRDHARSSSARPSPTSASASCSTRSSTSRPPPRPGPTTRASRARSTRRSRGSCSRCRRTWTRRTATASPSSGCARAASSGAWS